MKTKVRCNTCRFGAWGCRGPLPCNECIGFHKWQPKVDRPKPTPPMVALECVCGNKESTFKVHPLTGFVYNSNWSIRCGVCSRSMTEVK